MSTTIESNGRPTVQRKSLASQLDRLDGIIDTLGDGLNTAIADAVKDAVTVAVQQAVKAVLREVLTRPELLRSLIASNTPIQAAAPVQAGNDGNKPSILRRLCETVKGKLGNAFRWLKIKAGNACQWIGRKARELPSNVRSKAGRMRLKVTENVQNLMQQTREVGRKVWKHRRPVSLSLLIGLVVGGTGYIAGPVLSSVALGLCGSTMSLAGFLLTPFLRLWKAMNGQTV